VSTKHGICGHSQSGTDASDPGHSLWLKEAASYYLSAAATAAAPPADMRLPSVPRERFTEVMSCRGYEARAAGLRALHQQVDIESPGRDTL